MRGFNLAKFKKVKEDKDWATLIHQDGHSLVIAKAPLSPVQRKQLEHLATHETPKMAKGGKVPHYDEGTGDAQASDAESDPADYDGPQDNPSPPQAAAPPPTALAPSAGSPPQTALQVQVPGFEEEKAANLAGAQAVQNQGTQEAQAFGDASRDIGALPTQAQIVAANKDASQKLFDAYAQKKLDPDAYWENHSKINAGIGVLLSAVGQAIGQGHVQNTALNTIQTGINREIEAQKNNQSQAMNLWQMNRQALGSDLAANLATQNQLYTGLKYKIGQAAAESKGPIALANAQAANARIDQQIGLNNFKLSLLNPTSDNPDPASRIQFLVPPERQQKVVDEINAAKNTVANAPGIMEAFDQAAKEARPLSGGLSTSGAAFIPGMKTAGQQALQARLGPTFQDVEGTVRQAAMDNLDHNVTPKFGDNDSTIATKRQSLIDYMKSKSAAGASKSFGIDLSRFPSTNTASIGAVKKPGTEVRYTRQILNGKPYMVPVK